MRKNKIYDILVERGGGLTTLQLGRKKLPELKELHVINGEKIMQSEGNKVQLHSIVIKVNDWTKKCKCVWVAVGDRKLHQNIICNL